MKRLTLALLSWMMLFLAMGTAWAETAAETPVVPMPEGFTPADGATVAPGDDITFSIANISQNEALGKGLGTVVFVYVFGEEGDVPQPTMDEIYAAMGGTAFNFAVFMEGNLVMPGAGIPTDATGTIKMRVRMGVADPNSTNPNMPDLFYSEVTTATYTVAGAVKPSPTPKFDIASGTEVESGTPVKVSIEVPGGDNEENYWIYCVTDKPDFDFTKYATDEDIEAAGAKLVGNGNNITKLTKATTIKAAACKYRVSGAAYALSAWSEAVVASYTIKATEPDPTPVDKPTAPTFNPGSGAVEAGTVVRLTNGYDGDATKLLCYCKKDNGTTVDNIARITTKAQLTAELRKSAMMAKVLLYPAEGIAINKAMTLSAVTADTSGETVVWSEVVTESYTLAAASDKPTAPTFSPDGGELGDDNNEVTLTMSAADEAAFCDIYYVVNGTGFEFNVSTPAGLPFNEPGAEGVLIRYASPIKITKNQTIHAAVVRTESGDDLMDPGKLFWSEVVKKEFTFTGTPVADKPATPVIAPGNDANVTMGQKVTITCATTDAKVYYTTDGTAPSAASNEYTEPFALTEDMLIEQKIGEELVYAIKIRAIAVKDNVESTGTSVGYNAYPDKPVFTPAGDRVEANSTVTISCVPAKAKIYYTVDGSEPTMETGTLYTTPVEIAKTTTLKARAVLGQYQSGVTTATFTVGEDPAVEVAMPTFSVEAGEVEKGTKVEIACTTEDAKIYYTVDGGEPTAQSAEYKEAIVINEALTLKAIAILGENKSEVASAAYTVKVVADTVAMPTFSVEAGEVEKGTKVEIACATEGAKMYYTVDGSEPTAQSAEYKEAIVINEALTLKAIAILGDIESEVATAAYTIKDVANEELELAGVSVYPNPSNGVLNLELPVSATVEVFASTGVLRQRVEAGAGVVTLNIERSGIYFLRITGEGRTTVKRVVVR